jgi:hypothetical protein
LHIIILIQNFHVVWENQSNPSAIELVVLGAENSPDIDVDPAYHEFGNAQVGTDSDPVTITVTNNGTSPLLMEDLVKSGNDPDQFTIQNDNVWGQAIDPGANATFEVVLSPTSEGRQDAFITLPSNDPDEHFVIITLNPGTTIPALSRWSMIIFTLLLAGSAFWAMRRRKVLHG